MTYFLFGIYVCGVVVSFLFVGFFCVLGGKESDLWKPFAYAALWPITMPLFLTGAIG